MPVVKPRTRLVYFRVTEEEFRRCLDVCEAGGARSVSDLARTAVMNALGSNGSAGEIEGRLHTLERTVRELNDRLHAIFGVRDPDQGG